MHFSRGVHGFRQNSVYLLSISCNVIADKVWRESLPPTGKKLTAMRLSQALSRRYKIKGNGSEFVNRALRPASLKTNKETD